MIFFPLNILNIRLTSKKATLETLLISHTPKSGLSLLRRLPSPSSLVNVYAHISGKFDSDTWMLASSSGAYALGYPSMDRDLGATRFQATIGLSMYMLGSAILPLVTTSFSEEFGRQSLYVASVLGCLLMHVMAAL